MVPLDILHTKYLSLGSGRKREVVRDTATGRDRVGKRKGKRRKKKKRCEKEEEKNKGK